MSRARATADAELDPFECQGFAVLRTPLLAWDTFATWSEGLAAPAAGPGKLGAALEADAAKLRARLAAHFSGPALTDALFIASPSLHESLAAWLAAPQSERGERVEHALVRYFGRAAARPTPFGLFAGPAVMASGPVSRVTLAADETLRRRTRLDMDYLSELVSVLVANPAVRRAMTYRPNSSLLLLGDRARFVRQSARLRQRRYSLVSADGSEALDAVLRRASSGARFAELAAEAKRVSGASDEEADGFVSALVDAQLLEGSLGAPVTGDDALSAVISHLEALGAAPDEVLTLARVRQQLVRLDASGPFVSPSSYLELAGALEPLPVKPELQRLFQVDMARSGAGLALGKQAADAVAEGSRLLMRLTKLPAEDALSRFRRAFEARYEQREVPLLEALDEELGVGFDLSRNPAASGTPALAELPFASARAPSPAAVSAQLFARLTETLRAGAVELSLDERDLAAMTPDEPPRRVADTFSVSAALVAPSEADLQAGRFRVVLSGGDGPPGMRLQGRFCDVDPALEGHVRRAIEEEEALRPGRVFAEVVHLPEGRAGNVLFRPALRKTELVYLGHGAATGPHRLTCADLDVSIRGGRVVLRSRATGDEVLPRLTNAHAWQAPSNLSAYRFLCALATQGALFRFSFDWGGLAAAPFLPRVVALRRYVLSLARWRLDAASLAALKKPTWKERWTAVRELRERLALPRYVLQVEAEHQVPYDLDNVLCVESLVASCGSRETLDLQELYPGPNELCVRGPGGAFVHELLVPFARHGPVPAAPRKSPRAPGVERHFVPGSEWVFFKLYTGPAAADRVLLEVVEPALRAGRAAGATGWFFLRYADPEHHLRVRFQGGAAARAAVLAEVEQRVKGLLDAGVVHRVQLDTYQREVERYGGAEGVLLAEQLFTLDSDAVLACLPLYEGPDALELRFHAALAGVDVLLDALGLDVPARLTLVQGYAAALKRDVRTGAQFEQALSNRYRAERAAIEQLLAGGPSAGPLSEAVARLRHHAVGVRAWAERARAAKLDVPLGVLAESFVHMHVNRVIHASPVEHELVIYDFLERAYRSRLARAKGGLKG